MALKEYLIILGEGVRKRHRHLTERGKIIEFMVQLELFHKEIWKTILRFDTAHGFVHVDLYNLNGEQKKKPLDLTFEEALIYADSEINENWENYVERFLKGNYP